MHLRFPVWLAVATVLATLSRGAEHNLWPFWVGREAPAGPIEAWQAAGPLFFSKPGAEPGARVSGFRPFYLQQHQGEAHRAALFYPFFTWERQPGFTSFSFFQLLNQREQLESDGSTTRGFDVWPFYFSKQTGEPDESYRALFPIGGTIRHRLGSDRLTWALFPLYIKSVKSGRTITQTPWPFVRRIEGDGHKGLEVWPLYGARGREGDYRRRFWLWPLFYDVQTNLSAPQPDEKFGALPFYTRETGPGYRSETYLWPFFGYTHRTDPSAYDEKRFLWPLLVQGRGENRHVNRWAPFYTRSNTKGYDKTWLLWPLWRTANWEADGVAQEQEQLLFFLWWSLEQRSLTNPDAAPASKRHLWPLLSTWDNGAGRRQMQLLSPLEVFFPRNDTVRQLYTPLFALWRYDARGLDEKHWSLLWHAVTWHRTAESREFHLGPLFSYRRGEERTRVALGRGLLGLRRTTPGGGWRPFVFDFSRPVDTKQVARATVSP